MKATTPGLTVGDIWLWLDSILRRHGPQTRLELVLPSGLVVPCREAVCLEQDGVGAPVVRFSTEQSAGSRSDDAAL